jgi:deazaflavin-dependent oxidoreductase (nitroreductase family)
MRAWRILLGGVVASACAYGLYHRTDAYRSGNRLFYSDGRPNRAGRLFGDWWALIGGLGLTPSYLVTLETTGHRTGRVRSVAVVVGEYAGDRYIVSMLGERSPWVTNVRAAGGRAVIFHGRRHSVRLVEVPPGERAPIIKAYLARAVGARPHIPVDASAPVEAFEAIAADYPAFRIED